MANNVSQASIKIEGTRPLIWHAFKPESIPLERREKTGVAGNDPEEWKKTVLFNPETRQLYILSTYVFAAIRDGSKYTKKGRGTYQPMVTATLVIEEEIIYMDNLSLPLEPPTNTQEPVYIDIRGVRNPVTKGVNVRYRVACKAGWTCGFHLIWDNTIVPNNIMQACIIDAGRFAGIGNGRGIGMGRFKLTEFTLL